MGRRAPRPRVPLGHAVRGESPSLRAATSPSGQPLPSPAAQPGAKCWPRHDGVDFQVQDGYQEDGLDSFWACLDDDGDDDFLVFPETPALDEARQEWRPSATRPCSPADPVVPVPNPCSVVPVPDHCSAVPVPGPCSVVPCLVVPEPCHVVPEPCLVVPPPCPCPDVPVPCPDVSVFYPDVPVPCPDMPVPCPKPPPEAQDRPPDSGYLVGRACVPCRVMPSQGPGHEPLAEAQDRPPDRVGLVAQVLVIYSFDCF